MAKKIGIFIPETGDLLESFEESEIEKAASALVSLHQSVGEQFDLRYYEEGEDELPEFLY